MGATSCSGTGFWQRQVALRSGGEEYSVSVSPISSSSGVVGTGRRVGEANGDEDAQEIDGADYVGVDIEKEEGTEEKDDEAMEHRVTLDDVEEHARKPHG